MSEDEIPQEIREAAAGSGLALVPTVQGPAWMSSRLEAVVRAITEATEALDGRPCNVHRSQDECLGAAIVVKLADEGFVVCDAPEMAALVRGVAERAVRRVRASRRPKDRLN